MSVTYVTDFQGNLIPKKSARRIKDENGNFHYYQEGVSCIRMKDDQWYRTTTGKIVYDWSTKEWVFKNDFVGSFGLVEDGSIGAYSDASKEVTILVKKDTFMKKSVFDPFSKNLEKYTITEKRWNKLKAATPEIALANGYVESIFDGFFYKLDDCEKEDLDKMKTPNIPNSERTNTYSLDDDKEYRAVLEELYDNNGIKGSKELSIFARKYIPYTWGIEVEVQNGFIPKRIREPLGFRACRDGSLDTGQEYVGIPMEGGKGLEVLKLFCAEATRRCVVSNKCSVHLHFGEVRRDKLYVVSLWKLFLKIQDELRKYFPFSRTNSIREDGKVYAALLPLADLDTSTIMKTKEDAEFRAVVNREFQKIYTWLNHGHPLGEVYDEQFVKETRTQIIQGRAQKQYCYRVKKQAFTTRLPRHAVQGRKWDRKERYLAMNILNLFFSHSRTVEFRVHEASTNFHKILYFMCLNVAILKYAENFEKVLGNNEITIEQILKDHFSEEIASEIKKYFEDRKARFCNVNGNFKSSWKTIEEDWFENDKKFRASNPIYKL